MPASVIALTGFPAADRFYSSIYDLVYPAACQKVETQNFASHKQGLRWLLNGYHVYGLQWVVPHKQGVRWQVIGYYAYGLRWNVPHG